MAVASLVLGLIALLGGLIIALVFGGMLIGAAALSL